MASHLKQTRLKYIAVDFEKKTLLKLRSQIRLLSQTYKIFFNIVRRFHVTTKRINMLALFRCFGFILDCPLRSAPNNVKYAAHQLRIEIIFGIFSRNVLFITWLRLINNVAFLAF